MTWERIFNGPLGLILGIFLIPYLLYRVVILMSDIEYWIDCRKNRMDVYYKEKRLAAKVAWQDARDAQNRLTERSKKEYSRKVLSKLGYLKTENVSERELDNALAEFSKDYCGIADKHAAMRVLYQFWGKDIPAEEIPLRYKAPPEKKMPTLPIGHFIDLDAKPYVPNRWKVLPEDQLSSSVKGKLEWDSTKVALHLIDGQKNGGYVLGNNLRIKLATSQVMNANVLDYLLKNPGRIPEEWKGKVIFFWGTIYRNVDNWLFVRCLNWGGYAWEENCHPLDLLFYESYPALILSTSQDSAFSA